MTGTDGHDVVVIGAGPAGLAAAATLRGVGRRPVVLERAERPGASWRARYDGLRLNTSRWLSHLPGRRFERGAGAFPSRDDVAAYLEDYARHHDLDVRTGVEGQRVDRSGGDWTVRASDGDRVAARVVVATGWDRVPFMPDWPGRESFTGELIHASAYRNPEPYRGRDVLVVGPGCSGAEIAYHLSRDGARRVRLAVRTPPHVVLRSLGRFPADVLAIVGQLQPAAMSDPPARMLWRLTVGDLSRYGLGDPPDGLYADFAKRRMAPMVVDREVVEAIRADDIEIVGAVTGFDGSEVRLADGSRIEPDAVIAATGYRRGLEPLVSHLGVLGADGAPRVTGARTLPQAPGLHFVGFDPKLAGTFRQIRIETRRLARSAR